MSLALVLTTEPDQPRDRTQTQNHATQKVAPVNSIIHTEKIPRLTHRIDKSLV